MVSINLKKKNQNSKIHIEVPIPFYKKLTSCSGSFFLFRLNKSGVVQTVKDHMHSKIFNLNGELMKTFYRWLSGDVKCLHWLGKQPVFLSQKIPQH